MKIKRFFGADIRQAIKLVRDELGAEAVILSNRSVPGGIEIVAAVDYDAALVTEFGAKASGEVGATQVATSLRNAMPTTPPSMTPPVKPAPIAATRPSDAPAAAAKPAPARSTAAPKKESSAVWSQEPTLVEMRNELRSLRSILENQMAGLAWGDMQRRFPLRVELLQKLSKLGLSAPLCGQLASEIAVSTDAEQLWRNALDALTSRVPTTDDDILNQGGVVALLGPTGVGKTTTIAKLAARFALRHGARNVALITIDSYRIGAYEQLRAYGRILDVPVRLASNDEELRQTLADLSDRRLVLIDTTGMSQRDLRLPEQLRLLNQDRDWLRSYLVLSTTTRLSSLEEIVNVYSAVRPAGCILTKVDETTCLGSALSAVIQGGLPIAYVSDGQRVPEDLQPARAATLVQRSVAIMQQHESLLEEELFTNIVGRPSADAYL